MTRVDRPRLYLLVQILLPFVLFLALAGNNLWEYFGGDDLMNLYQYSGQPIRHWVAGLAHFWSSDWYRPMGGIVYLTLFRAFGLNALPFKLVLFALLLCNMALFLHVARRLTGSLQLASWALLLCCYHAAMNGLYLDFGTIYDILGYSFFFGALAVYIAWVSTARRPIAGLFAVVILYIASLCCKEIAVTLPVVLFLYSALLTRAIQTERWRWPLRGGLAIAVCSAIALFYTLGKMKGADSLANQALYAPHVTLQQYALTSASYLRQLLYLPIGTPSPTVALVMLGLTATAALLLRSRLMLFSLAAAIVTQLPVSFIAPRGAFAIYLAMPFYALCVVAFLDAATPLFKTSLRSFAGYLALTAVLVPLHLSRKPAADAFYTLQTRAYEQLVDKLDQWRFHLPPTGRVLLLNDPFPPQWISYDSLFLISMYANTTQAAVLRMKDASLVPPLSEANLYDYVIDYDTVWRLLKSPGKPLAGAWRLEALAGKAPLVLVSGFDPPSPDGWRPLHQAFAIQVRSGTGPAVLSLSLAGIDPATVTAHIDGRIVGEQRVPTPGVTVELAVPIARGTTQEVQFEISPIGAGPAAPRVALTAAQLRDPGHL